MTTDRNPDPDATYTRTEAIASDAKSHLQCALVALNRLSPRSHGPSPYQDFLELEEAHRAIYHALIKIDECADVGVLQRAS